jgi:crossover junction endodeoxyribonuclease RusA
MTMLRIDVAAPPAPQGSKRHVGGGRMVEMSKGVGPWREAVRSETQQQVKLHDWAPSGPMAVDLMFFLARPAGHYGTGRNAGELRPSAPAYPAKRPDLDKLVRSTLDGLTFGGAYADDALVVHLVASKLYVEPGRLPGVRIYVEELS